jgi:hypothetical protein
MEARCLDGARGESAILTPDKPPIISAVECRSRLGERLCAARTFGSRATIGPLGDRTLAGLQAIQ